MAKRAFLSGKSAIPDTAASVEIQMTMPSGIMNILVREGTLHGTLVS